MLSRFFVTFSKMYRSAKKNVNCLVFRTLSCINIRCWIKSWSDRFPLWRRVWSSWPHLCCSILSQLLCAHSRDLIDCAGWLWQYCEIYWYQSVTQTRSEWMLLEIYQQTCLIHNCHKASIYKKHIILSAKCNKNEVCPYTWSIKLLLLSHFSCVRLCATP